MLREKLAPQTVSHRANASNSKCAINPPKVGFNQSSDRNTFLKRLINLTFGGISTLFLFRCVCPAVSHTQSKLFFLMLKAQIK